MTSRPAPGAGVVAGIAAMIVSVALFSAMDALVKLLAARYPVLQIVFFRSAFGFLPLLWPMVAAGGLRQVMASRRLGLHVFRGVMGTVSLIAFFLSYRYLGLAEAVALFFVSPLIMTALSMPLFGEHVGPRRWVAVAMGFVGVLIMVRPGGTLFMPAALLPVAGAFAYALAAVTIKRLGDTDGPLTIVFYFTLVTTLLSALALPLVWHRPESLVDWLALAMTGVLGGCAQLALTQAFRLAPVSVVAPFEYLSLPWAIGWGWLIWAELPGLSTWLGAAAVVASGLYVLHREAYQARQPVGPLGP